MRIQTQQETFKSIIKHTLEFVGNTKKVNIDDILKSWTFDNIFGFYDEFVGGKVSVVMTRDQAKSLWTICYDLKLNNVLNILDDELKSRSENIELILSNEDYLKLVPYKPISYLLSDGRVTVLYKGSDFI